MAARLHTRHSDQTRAKIQASVLIDRLHKHALGDLDMSSTQVRAAETLLDRSVPKLAQIQHTGADGGPVQFVISESDAKL